MEWYRQDIQILKDIGFQVTIATTYSEIPWDSDFYFSWWSTGSILPLTVAKIRRKPLIILGYGSEVVNSIPNLGYNELPPIKKKVVRVCLDKSDLALSISASIQKEAQRLGSKDYPVVYLGLDTAHFCPPPTRPVSGHILTISHLNKPNMKRKALLSIIHAMPAILAVFPEQQFILAGAKLDGFRELSNLAYSLGVENSIQFPGRISNEEKLNLLQGASIYLQPTRHEGFGMAIAEAMSCELPVVTSAIGSVPEVTGNHCIYSNPDEPATIATAVINLLNNPNQRHTMGIAGKEWVLSKFSISERRTRIDQLLRQHFSNYRIYQENRMINNNTVFAAK